jgi:hypothetical protein
MVLYALMYMFLDIIWEDKNFKLRNRKPTPNLMCIWGFDYRFSFCAAAADDVMTYHVV